MYIFYHNIAIKLHSLEVEIKKNKDKKISGKKDNTKFDAKSAADKRKFVAISLILHMEMDIGYTWIY